MGLLAALDEARAVIMGASSVVGAGTVLEPEDRNSPEQAAGSQAGAGSGTERKTEHPEEKEQKK